MDSITVSTKGAEGTGTVAALLAPQLRPGDVVLLKGGLATGKTTFVKALAAAAGSTAVVTSPTFTIAHFYPLEQGKILHIDTYRLAGIHEFRDLGLARREQLVDQLRHVILVLFEVGECLLDFVELLNQRLRLRQHQRAR